VAVEVPGVDAPLAGEPADTRNAQLIVLLSLYVEEVPAVAVLVEISYLATPLLLDEKLQDGAELGGIEDRVPAGERLPNPRVRSKLGERVGLESGLPFQTHGIVHGRYH